jgi:alpha-beta hydrolase superfamily lysophospholipase
MVWQVVAVVVWVVLVVVLFSLLRKSSVDFWRRLVRNFGKLGVSVLVAAALALTSFVVYATVGAIETSRQVDSRQAALEPFYTQFQGTTGAPGELLDYEVMDDVTLSDATAYRILYRSTGATGEPVISGGMVFVPNNNAMNRPVVAWAHPTTGLGDQCAPSRNVNPLADTSNWLPQMMSQGWVVTATDYAGLGTPGTSMYIDGRSEAADVTYSVKAAEQIPGTNMGKQWVVWGHSQGGNSSLWTGELAEEFAPERELLGVAAAAPAAEVNLIMGAQWDTTIGWVLGPEVTQGLATVYTEMTIDGVVSAAGQSAGPDIADACVTTTGGLMGWFRQNVLNERYFESDPTKNAGWVNALEAQTPKPLTDVPVLIVQSLADEVVLPWPNAVLQGKWCKAGSDLQMMWLGKISHGETAITSGPSVVNWIEQRFSGDASTPNCSLPLPLTIPSY